MDADGQEVPERIPPEQVDLAVEVLRMLAEPTRIQLLWALTGGELSVTALAERTGRPGPSVSQHLAKLRMARLVTTRRSANQVFYRLGDDHVAQLVVDAVHHAEHVGPGVPAHHRGDAEVTPLDGLTGAP